MKKLILFTLSFLMIFSVSAQDNDQLSDVPPAYLKLLPKGANINDLKASDIPSPEVLKQMGFSDVEIADAINFKMSKGKYKKVKNGNSDSQISLKDLHDVQNQVTSMTIDTMAFPKQRIFGQDIFRHTKIDFFDRARDAKAPENYKIGSGDEISISVWGFSEFLETLVVDERGYINPSSYGRIYVKGLTFKKTRSLLKTKFSSFLDMKNSEIDITLSYSKVITVNIVGEVYYPGSYSIPAINTAFNALIAARGPNQLGTVRNIYIKRDGETVDSLDIYQFLFNPSRSQDIYMQDGDYLFVPPAQNLVEVIGAVNRPYTYEAKAGESVASIIKYAGGYTKDAFTDVVTLKRIEYNLIRVNDVYKDHANSTILQNGDKVVVNSISNKLSNLVSVEGSIGVQGDYEFIKGERLLGLLERAKCIDEKTFAKVYVIRLNADRTKTHIALNFESIINDANHEDNILIQEYDIIRVLSIDDFDDDFFVSVFGEVRNAGEFRFGEKMTLQDLLFQAGGLTQKAEGSRIEVNRLMESSSKKLKPIRTVVKNIKIGEDLMLSSEAQEFTLHPFDQVFVRENPDYEEPVNIVLTGEVKYPGSYSLISKDERVSSVIKRAGGLTNHAFLDGVKMSRKFNFKFQDDNEFNIPDVLLDSILSDVELSNIYNMEMLSKEKLKFKHSDSLMYDVVYFDIEKALSNPKSKHNIILLEGDSLFIPKYLDVVHVTGALHNINGNSISAPFYGKRAHYYVRNFAGGYVDINRKSSTVVVYPNGVTKKSLDFGLFTISPKVKPGSTIKVMNDFRKKRKKKEDIDYNLHIQSVITQITAVISLWLLIDRVNNSF